MLRGGRLAFPAWRLSPAGRWRSPSRHALSSATSSSRGATSVAAATRSVRVRRRARKRRNTGPSSIARSPPEAPPLAPVRRPRSASARWLCDGRRPRRPTSSGLERRATLGPARALRGEVPAAIAFPLHGVAKEANLPSARLPRPAGFEDEWLLAFFVALSGDFGRTSPGARWSLRWHALRARSGDRVRSERLATYELGVRPAPGSCSPFEAPLTGSRDP